MSGKKPGLPQGFALEIPEGEFEDRPPATIGDFLDEDDAATRTAVKQPLPRVASEKKVAGRIEPTVLSTRKTYKKSAEVVSKTATVRNQPSVATTPLRRQINLTPDADDVINELLAVIKRYSNEPHPNASDVLNALVLAAGESINELQLQSVPRRGKYGEPTVRIYLQQLKTALQEAIGQHEKYKGVGDQDS